MSVSSRLVQSSNFGAIWWRTVHNEEVNTGIYDRCDLDFQVKRRLAITVSIELR